MQRIWHKYTAPGLGESFSFYAYGAGAEAARYSAWLKARGMRFDCAPLAAGEAPYTPRLDLGEALEKIGALPVI